MDPALITAVSGAATTVGVAVGFFIKRADDRRRRREELLIAHLTKQIEDINASHEKELERLRAAHKQEIEQLRADHEKEVHRLRGEVLHERRLRHLVQKDATHWREQLIEHGIDPDPAEWSELSEEVHP